MIRMFLAFVLSGVLATICHELTHYLTAQSLGKNAHIDVANWEVVWERHGEPENPSIEDYAVGAAPFIIGIIALGVVIALGRPIAPWTWFGWAIYTLVGAVTGDFRLAESPDGSAVGQ